MPTAPTVAGPGDTLPARGARLRDTGADPVEARDVPADLAVRLHALRRARRDARTRASRVRRVLLAPTVPDGTYTQRTPRDRH
ncbi:hypothetical protein BZB76_4605 [Actinomadura pelletieri DSM 43383]|uniref:Uncharacterized protein n=1 Tax=Actinomadura pelletieri DSM 43383 TaxID=1120940 RepID=A0A495QI05_9ACTN|nr:hypothetical protein [Actinomadura pelletieri]RKS71795.1 hypothetical protein BZB76_4605 [Actinomadura pelletieri DSM 43383]